MSQDEESILWEVIVSVILSKNVYMNMCTIPNGFRDRAMTGQNYLDFLQNEVPKQLEDVPLATRIAMYFQHDGGPSHYTRHVM